MLSMEFIKSGEKTYQQQIKDLEEQVKFFKNKSQRVEKANKKLKDNWNKLNKFIEEEKNRLATQVSNTYEDSLDKIHFVNEDIFNELTKVSGKMQELGNDKEC